MKRSGIRRILLGVIAVIALTSAPSFAADPQYAENLPPQYEARYKALINELRCLVCQNETLADSGAELAGDLRREIREMLVRGDSDRQIIDFLVARYGDFVLYRPPVRNTTLMLWYGPFALLALGVVIAVVTVRRRTHTAPPALSEEQHRAVQNLLSGRNEERGS